MSKTSRPLRSADRRLRRHPSVSPALIVMLWSPLSGTCTGKSELSEGSTACAAGATTR